MRLDKWIRTTLALLMAAAGLHGCDRLHDDMSECDLFLKFRYDYNLSREDWFSQQVSEVRVFVFDTEGGYVTTLSEKGAALAQPGYKMPIPFDYKGYTMVVWAGRTDDDYTLPSLAVGDPLETLTLRYQPTDNTSDRHIAPLWYSGPLAMTFPDEEGTTQTASLLRDTNDIALTILKGGATEDDPANYTIRITGANSAYDHLNRFIPGTPQIAYLPSTTVGVTTQLYTMRIVKSEPLLLTVVDNASGSSILAGGKPQIDLSEFFIQSKPDGMGDQEYLDRRYLWDIKLNIGGQDFLAVSITINGWTYWFQPTDL